MKVGDLIELLKRLPGDTDIYIPDSMKDDVVALTDERDPKPVYEKATKQYPGGRLRL